MIKKVLAILAAVALGALTATAYDASFYAKSSRLASGRWAKVRVTADGIQQLTKEQLAALGFSDYRKVKVYGYGGATLSSGKFTDKLTDDIRRNYATYTDDGRVLFYGCPDVRVTLTSKNRTCENYVIERNHYSTAGYYFITDSDFGDAQPSALPYTPGNPAEDTHIAVDLYEPEVQNPGLGGAEYHGEKVQPGTSVLLPFDVHNFCGKNEEDAMLAVQMAVFESSVWSTYELEIRCPDAFRWYEEEPLEIESSGSSSLNYTLGRGNIFIRAAQGSVPDGKYDFSVVCPENPDVTYMALDHAVLIYPRKNVLGNRPEIFMNYDRGALNTNINIARASATANIWDVTDPGCVLPHMSQYSAADSTLSITRTLVPDASISTIGPRRLIAFDAAATHHAPEIVGILQPQDIHASSTPDLLVITTDALLPYAQQLADAHAEYDNLEVAVYTQQQIFNEFSSGTPDIMAFRRLARMYSDRNPGRLKYVMLYGSATWDQRGIVSPARYEQVLTYEVEHAVANGYAARHAHLNTATDNVIGMLSDSFEPRYIYQYPVSLAIGRVPVSRPDEAEAVNAKIIGFIKKPYNVTDFTNVVLVSDDGDGNRHFDQSVEFGNAIVEKQPAATLIRAYNSLYQRENQDNPTARSILQNAMMQGVGLFDFCGHARPDYFTAEHLWSQQYSRSTPNTVLPFVMLSTCDSYNLDRPGSAMAECMLLQPKGGAIGVVASLRSVYLDYNQMMNLAIGTEYALTQGPRAIGDIYRCGYNRAHSSNVHGYLEQYLNNLCYNFCGDPAVRIYGPTRKAEITKFMGLDITDPATASILPLTLEAYSKVPLEGRIATADGDTDTSFNGKLNITLYDAPRKAGIIIKDYYDLNDTITADENILAQAAVEVVGGKWQTQLTIPANAYEGAPNRIRLTAESQGFRPYDRLYATGRFDGMRIVTRNPVIPEAAPLEITEFYLNSPDFADGDVTGQDVVAYAHIVAGDGGLNVASTIGSATHLILDGKKDVEGAANSLELNPDGTADIALPITEIADGRHTLRLSVADNYGTRVTRDLAFTVVTHAADIALLVDEHPVRTGAVIDATHSFGDDIVPECRLVIADAMGNTVRTENRCSFPFEWDLTDNNGRPVADGQYSAFVLARNGGTYAHSPKVSLTVIK